MSLKIWTREPAAGRGVGTIVGRVSWAWQLVPVLAACVAGPPRTTANRAPMAIEWNPAGTTFAYRVRRYHGGALQSTEHVFVERGPEGEWILRDGGAGFPDPMREERAESVFPTSQGRLDPNRARTWSSTSGTAPFGEWTTTATVRLVGVRGRIATTRVEMRRARRGRGVVAEQHVVARFDLDARRYLDARMVWLRPPLREPIQEEVWSFDATETRRRVANIRRARAAARDALRSFDADVERHGATVELAQLETALRNAGENELSSDAEALLLFHARAHPEALFRLAATMPPGSGRTLLLSTLLFDERRAAAIARSVAPAVLQSVRARIGADPDLAHRDLPQPLGDRNLEPPTEDELRAHFDEPTVLAALIDRHVRDAPDSRTIVPLLADVLDHLGPPTAPVSPVLPTCCAVREPETAETLRRRCIGLLQALTYRILGDDPESWRALWSRSSGWSAEQWALEGIASGVPRFLRRQAFAELESLHLSGRALDRVGQSLGDEDFAIRVDAAAVLAESHDDRAIPVLLRMLEADDAGLREPAFQALANLHDSTFGFRPDRDRLENAAALARWHEWARRRDFRRR